MNKRNIIGIIKYLSKGFLNRKIDGKLCAKVVESLIATNEDIVDKKLLDFADFLAQYNPDVEGSGFYNNKDLEKEIKCLEEIK